MGISNLTKAKINKNDEFYTLISDVSRELMHYKKHFNNKIVFCNCDDPTHSAFWKYFHLNFSELGLRKLISTHYEHDSSSSYKMEYEGGDDNNVELGVKTPLKENGDFRSEECLSLLEESDIVVTNPPFSLFRDFIDVLVKYNKKFLIMGNINAVTYKNVFPLIKNNKLWLGESIHSGDKKFIVPDHYSLLSSNSGIDEDGNKFVRVSGIRWFTNLDYSKRHEILILYKNYNSDDYPKYDNYNAINVNKVKDIPVDYEGAMGVPITFIDKYNPDQFEILDYAGGVGWDDFNDIKTTKTYINTLRHNTDGSVTSSNINSCANLKLISQPKGIYYTASNADGILIPVYKRLLIRRKQV